MLAAFTTQMDVTSAERARFLAARENDPEAADEMLNAYVAWRASALPLAEGHPRIGSTISEWMHFHGTARDGSRILWINGAPHALERLAVWLL